MRGKDRQKKNTPQEKKRKILVNWFLFLSKSLRLCLSEEPSTRLYAAWQGHFTTFNGEKK